VSVRSGASSSSSSRVDDTAIFTLLRASEKGYDLRLIDAHPAVQTTYTNRGDGIEKLAKYFDGVNADGVQFASTQPLFMWHGEEGGKVMRLRVGKRVDGETGSLPPAPEPGSELALTVAGGNAVAVIVVKEQNVTPDVAKVYLSRLREMLAEDGIKTKHADESRFGVCQYGELYTMAERLNELLVEVAL